MEVVVVVMYLLLSLYGRVGWSVDGADLSLGEDKHSYGYGGTGKVATNKQFKSYGEAYGPDDFIGCFLVCGRS